MPRFMLRTARPDPSRRAALRAGGLAACLVAAALAGCEGFDPGSIGPALSDDAPLSVAVREALNSRPETMNQLIHVKTLEPGVVRLSGTVDTDIARQFAQNIAIDVPGVTNVVNTIFTE